MSTLAERAEAEVQKRRRALQEENRTILERILGCDPGEPREITGRERGDILDIAGRSIDWLMTHRPYTQSVNAYIVDGAAFEPIHIWENARMWLPCRECHEWTCVGTVADLATVGHCLHGEPLCEECAISSEAERRRGGRPWWRLRRGKR